jgi:uncharacterized membrane protein
MLIFVGIFILVLGLVLAVTRATRSAHWPSPAA